MIREFFKKLSYSNSFIRGKIGNITGQPLPHLCTFTIWIISNNLQIVVRGKLISNVHN